MATTTPQNNTERPPVVTVMGHIDHGKSTLLDYIRKSNVAGGEAGGITQHIAAYEVTWEHEGKDKRITFIDTPGHEAFASVRQSGVGVADIAVLVISAEDSIKAQTLEALKQIQNGGIPFVVAINKIDLPNANPDKVKADLIEHGVYVEGYGGDVPVVSISAKMGQGITDLLDMILLVAEVGEFTGTADTPGSGFVIEAHVDTKKGVSATLIIKDGTVDTGQFIVTDKAWSPVRIMEDFTGTKIKTATFSSPIQIIGWNAIPDIGTPFTTYQTKKEAEQAVLTEKETPKETANVSDEEEEEVRIIPMVIKADVSGSIAAIQHELEKIKNDRIRIKVVSSGVGTISENDVRAIGKSKHGIVVGFNVHADSNATELAQTTGVALETFDIIYKLSEWLETIITSYTPTIQVEEVRGRAKILKIFSKTKNKQVLGGRVDDGSLTVGAKVNIVRRGAPIGVGTILELQAQKVATKEVSEGNQFGANIESKHEIASGDTLEAFVVVEQ